MAIPSEDLVKNISDQKGITDVFQIQTSILELIAQRKSISESLDQLCLMSEKLVGDCMAAVMVFNENKTALSILAAPSFSEEIRKDFNGLRPEYGYGSCGSAVASGKSQFIEDVSTDAAWMNLRAAAEKYQIGSCWSYPVYIDGEIFGSFSFTSGIKRKPNTLHQYILQSVSHLASFAIERAKADELLLHSKIAFENSAESILIADSEGMIFKTNPAFIKLTGFDEKIILNKNFYELLISDNKLKKEINQIIEIENHWRGNIDIRYQNDENSHLLMNIRKITIDDTLSVQYVIVLSDISRIKESEDKLSYLAHHDLLTNLSNRLAFEKDAAKRLIDVNEDNSLVLMFIDLDGFKQINDNEGHVIGDELLKAVSKRLASCVRDDDLLARYGGDEFTLIFSFQTKDDIENFANRVIKTLATPFRIQDKQHFMTASIGIALAPKDGVNIKEIINCADAAMYRAKALGRNCYQYYADEQNKNIYRNLQVEDNLHSAIENNELEILYQPIFSKDRRIHGYESLIRWNSKDTGVIQPLELLPMAEKLGLIDQVEEWVLFTAMKTAKSWQKNVSTGDKIFINISPLQIKPELLEIVRNALSATGFLPENLVIELSENILDMHLHDNREMMDSLCDLGVQLAIDDFGTGHLSLEPIKLFPIKYIKLDKSLINNFSENNENAKVLDVIFAVSQAMSITTVAEGIETQA
ncbi:MAG: EAL domain-containing protein, partial [Gammaproteobacteria bacterium]|nr:EAL domain-containing protein [Gammaproteobacteria bacterium]